MKFKLNSLEKRWVLYDVANSAFTLLVSTIIPIYFNYLAGNAGVSDVDYLAYWGYATSAATILVAVLGPVLGGISDFQNRKKSVFLGVLLVGAAGCVFLGFVSSWFWFLLLFVITRIAYSLSLVIYDSMLPDVTTKERMDELSARGYAWGYIGSCLPFLLSLLLVLFYEKLGLTMASAMTRSLCADGGLVAGAGHSSPWDVQAEALYKSPGARGPLLLWQSGKRGGRAEEK